MTSKVKSYFLLFNLYFLVFFCYYNVFPQNGILMSVSGQIKDANTYTPQAGVEVLLFKYKNDVLVEHFNSISDKNGIYKIGYLEAGRYEFILDIPGIGMVFLPIYIYDQGEFSQEELNFLNIIEGKNVNLNFFIRESNEITELREEYFDGRVINYTLNYINKDKISLRGSEGKISSREQTIKYNGLTIILKDPVDVPDDEPLPGNHPDGKGLCMITTDIKYIPEDFYCKTGTDIEKCAYVKKLPVEVTVEIFMFSKARLKKILEKMYLECKIEDWYVQCQYDCLIVHEKTHQELSVEILKKLWDELWKKYTAFRCCENVSCQYKLECLVDDFKKTARSQLKETEDDADKKQHECKTNNECWINKLNCEKKEE